MERRYETICIIKSDMGDTAIAEIVKKASTSIETGAGKVNILDEWGRRRLAYPIEKKHEGFYVLFDYTSTAEVSKELERSFRLNESVIRYQTVRLEGKAADRAAVRQAAIEARPEATAEAKPEVVAEVKPEVSAEAKPEVAAEVKPEVAAEAKPDAPVAAAPAPAPAVDDKSSEGGKDE